MKFLKLFWVCMPVIISAVLFACSDNSAPVAPNGAGNAATSTADECQSEGGGDAIDLLFGDGSYTNCTAQVIGSGAGFPVSDGVSLSLQPSGGADGTARYLRLALTEATAARGSGGFAFGAAQRATVDVTGKSINLWLRSEQAESVKLGLAGVESGGAQSAQYTIRGITDEWQNFRVPVGDIALGELAATAVNRLMFTFNDINGADAGIGAQAIDIDEVRLLADGGEAIDKGEATDTTPPTLGAPRTRATDTEATVTIRVSEESTLFWVLYADGSAAPSDADALIAAARGATSGTVIKNSGRGGRAVQAAGDVTISITGLDANTNYDFYAVARDAAGNVSPVSRRADIATTAPQVPDLRITAVRIVPASVTEGGSRVTLSATVRNSGTGSSATTTLHYYRSTNTLINTRDAHIGSDAVGILAASATETDTITLTAPATPGAYYYGACVASVTGEADTTNNCSDAATLTVTPTVPLDTTPPTLGVPSARATDTEATVTIHVSEMSTLFWALYADGSAAPSDESALIAAARSSTSGAVIKNSGRGGRAVNAAGDITLSITGLAARANYDFYAVARDAAGNTSPVSRKADIATTAPQVPDLQITAIRVAPDSVTEGGSRVMLSATVRNHGTGLSAATTLRYYRSTNNLINTRDAHIGSDAVGILAASATESETITLTAPSTPGTYYYGACVASVSGEADTTNNCSGAATLTVTPTVPTDTTPPTLGVPSARATDSEATVTIHVSEESTLFWALYADGSSAPRDADALIAAARGVTSSTVIKNSGRGGRAVNAVGEVTLSITGLTASRNYDFYAVARDAAGNRSPISRRADIATTVAQVPDLQITAIRVAPASVTEGGGRVTLSATVRNSGTGPTSVTTTLRYYRSTNNLINTRDVHIGSDTVGILAASATETDTITLTAPATPGTYYYGACVASVRREADTTNNCSGAATLTVTPATPSDTTPPTLGRAQVRVTDMGATVTMHVNEESTLFWALYADGSSAPRDADALIAAARGATSGAVVKNSGRGGRAVNAAGEVTVFITGIDASTNYDFYAVARDAAGNKSPVSTKADIATTVLQVPDLRIDAVRVAPASVTAGGGGRVTLSATVRNSGSGSSAATTLRYYRSTNNLINTRDVQIGTDAVGILAASATEPETITLAAPATPGTYYYGACVASVSGEADTTNNCSDAATLTVTPTVPSDTTPPTLGILNALVTDTGATVLMRVNEESTLFWALYTDGSAAPADASTLIAAARGATSGAVIKNSGRGGRAVQAAGDVTIPITGLDANTNYDFYAVARDSAGNSSPVSRRADIATTAPQVPDLQITAVRVAPDSVTAGGSRVTLSATVRNSGSGSSAATTLRYYRSTNNLINTRDVHIGSDAVSTLAASATESETITLTAPSTPGTYYYGACVASVSGEADTTNNCSGAATLTVTPATPSDTTPPTLGAPRARATDSEATVTIHVNEESTLFWALYVDGSAAPSDADSLIAAARGATRSPVIKNSGRTGHAVQAAGDVTLSITGLTARANYEFYAVARDAAGNTSRVSRKADIATTAPQVPDLRITAIRVAPDSVTAGGSRVTLSATVRNSGSGSSAATTLRYYRSTNNLINTRDAHIGSDAVSTLAASATENESITLTAPSTPGTYYYGACVASVTGEADTTNNCSDAATLTVTPTVPSDTTPPTLGVPSARATDTEATVTIRVNEESTLFWALYVDGSAAPSDADSLIAAARGATRSPVIKNSGRTGHAVQAAGDVTLSITGLTARANYEFYAVARDAAGNTSRVSRKADITTTAPQVPDLQITTIRVAPDSVTEGGSRVTLSATVRNSGTGPTSVTTTLRYYRSTNNLINTRDVHIGSDTVGILAASATETDTITLTAPATPGTYYYGACVASVRGEADTTNNCSDAATLTVTAMPTEPSESPASDLQITAIRVMPASVTPSGRITLSATVRNSGSGSSAATTLRYYRSSNNLINTRDVQIGTDTVGTLAASATETDTITLTAPATPGMYYYGACVASVSGEADATNNCSDAATLTVTTMPTEPTESQAPDLQVSTIRVAPATVTAGSSSRVTLSATVRNSGTGSSAATTLRYYRSANDNINTRDVHIGSDAVGILAASATGTETITLTAPAKPGTYYYGACVASVSGEADTTNNCSDAATLTVTAMPTEPTESPAPDLQISTIRVAPASITPSGRITLSATVRNGGTGSSAATTLRYYRSANDNINTRDVQIGTDAVGTLAAAATAYETITLTAPSTPGKYYYGACVASVSGEADATNNCSEAVTLTVTTMPTEPTESQAPDLRISAIRVAPASVTVGGRVTLSATVRNSGTGPTSAATTLRYYRSANDNINTRDVHIGSDAVGILAASATESETITLTAPSTPGTYYYGACVASVSGEADVTNNCSEAATLTVTAMPTEPTESQAPDLHIRTIRFSPASVTVSGRVVLSTTVRNGGSGSSAATILRYYRSTNALINTRDVHIGSDAVGTLAASATADETITLTAPATPGTYYYGACVVSVSGEADTTNNCSEAVTLTVTAMPTEPSESPASDLQITAIRVMPASVTPSGRITLSATVRNSGSGASAATTLRYYRSANDNINTRDVQIGTDAVGTLAASATESETITLTAPATPGTYYYGACVASVTGEADTTNNCSDAATLTVTAMPTEPSESPASDLQITAIRVMPASVTPSGRITLSATVRNSGTGSSAATTLRYYRSSNILINTRDVHIGTDTVGILAASATGTETITLTAPSTPGKYYYGACVASVSGEADATNNCSDAATLTVTAMPTEPTESQAPDLHIRTIRVALTSVTVSGRVVLSATVRNRGSGASAATTLRYYRSTNALINTRDVHIGSDAVGTLAASATADETITLTAPATPGTYYYGTCVVSVSGEASTTNNCSEAVTLTVTAPTPTESPAPDLHVSAIRLSPDSVAPSGRVVLSATVRNSGSGSSARTTLRYYRSTNDLINTRDVQIGTDAVGILAASATGDETITLTAPSTPGTYYYGACVASVSGEAETTNNCSETATLTVAAADDHSNTQTGATSITAGSTKRGTIETGTDIDYFRITTTGAGTIRAYTTGSLDTHGRIYASGSMRSLASDDDSGSGRNFDVSYRVNRAGTYYIEVRSYGIVNTGAYTLHATFTR